VISLPKLIPFDSLRVHRNGSARWLTWHCGCVVLWWMPRNHAGDLGLERSRLSGSSLQVGSTPGCPCRDPLPITGFDSRHDPQVRLSHRCGRVWRVVGARAAHHLPG